MNQPSRGGRQIQDSSAHDRTERDRRTEESYSLSVDILQVFGDAPVEREEIPAIVARHVAELAEWFFGQASAGRVAGGLLSEKLRAWEQRHFGRELEPVAHGMLSYEVFRKTRRNQGPPASNFSSPAEEWRWIEASRDPRRNGEELLDWIERLCRRAGAPIGPGVQDMPPEREPRPSVRATHNRLEQLRAQAAEVTGGLVLTVDEL